MTGEVACPVSTGVTKSMTLASPTRALGEILWGECLALAEHSECSRNRT